MFFSVCGMTVDYGSGCSLKFLWPDKIRADLMFFTNPIRIMRKLPGKLDTNKDAK
jgi:hypothetical protein